MEKLLNTSDQVKSFNLTKKECKEVAKIVVTDVLNGNQNIYPIIRNLKSMTELISELTKGLKERLIEKMRTEESNTIHLNGTAFTLRKSIKKTHENSPAIMILEEKIKEENEKAALTIDPLNDRIKELKDVADTITEMTLVEEGELQPAVKSDTLYSVAVTLSKE